MSWKRPPARRAVYAPAPQIGVDRKIFRVVAQESAESAAHGPPAGQVQVVNERTEATDRFRALYDTAYADVLRYVHRREPATAEDIVAEAMLVAWRRIDDVPPDPGDARAWLFGVARGCLLNQRRSMRRHGALAVRLADDGRASGVASDPAVGYVARASLADAWARLSADQQEVVAMSVLDGLTSEQAARILGISPNAFRHRLARARSALRRHLGDDSTVVAFSTRAVPHPEALS